MYRIAIVSFLIFLASLTCTASGVSAADKSQKDWTLNLKDVDIRVFLEQVSSITGENFVVDPQVKGTVTVVASKPMSAEAVNELFLTVLRVNGLAAVPSGSSTRIVPLANAKLEGGGNPGGQRIVTRVLQLKNSNVEEAVKILKPLVSQTGYIEGSVFSNSIIISDYADNVRQIMKAIESLDKDGSSNLVVIPLKEGWVGNIVPLLEAMSPVQFGEAGKSHNRLRVVADERSNSIIVRGDKEECEQIRKLVETLDQKTPNGNSIQLIRLQNADAKEVAALLRGIVFNSSRGAPAAPNLPAAGLGNTSSTNAAALANLFSASPASNGNAEHPEEPTTTQSFIQADVALNALVVRAEPAVMNEIRNLVSQLDVRRPQVLIEAAIVEITADKTDQLGVQLAGGDVAASIHAGTTQFSENGLAIGSVLSQLGSGTATAATGEGLAVALGTKAKFDVLIQALENTTGANLLSTPSITTLDNEAAKIVVGQNVPFRTGSFSTFNSGVGNPFTTIERQDIGITLKVVPQIHEGNLVKLNIEQEVSSIANSSAQTAGAADIITNKRTIQTKILAEDGETVVLGGLMEDDTSESVSKVPILGDIPILGALFSDTSQSGSKRNLLVFLRPTVLHNKDQMSAVTQRQYGRVYDLELGNKKLKDDYTPLSNENAEPAAVPVPVPAPPPAETIFNPPPKTMPWLIE